MQATSERITSLCSSLGLNTPNGYIPSDDCQINLDELAFSIWRDDEAQRNVSAQCYQLGVFKKDFIPLLLNGVWGGNPRVVQRERSERWVGM